MKVPASLGRRRIP